MPRAKRSSTMADTVGLVSAERRAKSVRETRPPRRMMSRTIERLTSRIARLSTFPWTSCCMFFTGGFAELVPVRRLHLARQHPSTRRTNCSVAPVPGFALQPFPYPITKTVQCRQFRRLSTPGLQSFWFGKKCSACDHSRRIRACVGAELERLLVAHSQNARETSADYVGARVPIGASSRQGARRDFNRRLN